MNRIFINDECCIAVNAIESAYMYKYENTLVFRSNAGLEYFCQFASEADRVKAFERVCAVLDSRQGAFQYNYPDERIKCVAFSAWKYEH